MLRIAVSRYPIHAAADRLAPAFSVALRAAFAVARKKPVARMVAALEGALAKVLTPLLTRGLVTGGQSAALTLKVAEEYRAASDRPQLHMVFNATNPRIVKWAKKHAAELIDGIAKATKEWIKEATTAHAEGQLDDAEYSAALKDAVGNEARAETIARTETMRAVHAGQREAWQQAVDQELLDKSLKRSWIVTADDRLCPICEPLDGKEADLDGLFAGEFDGPPAHPNCRCTEGLA